MAIPNEETVRRILTKNERQFACRNAVDSAWKTVSEKYPDQAWWRRKSTRAALMWEHSVNNAISSFEDDLGVVVITHHDTSSFLFDDTVLARFKKASIQLHTSNYPTLLASRFHHHDEDLFGFSSHQRIEIAHVLNRFETGIDWIGVVAREGHRILWHFELPAQEGGATVEMLPVDKPLAPAGDRLLRLAGSTTEKRDDKKISDEETE